MPNRHRNRSTNKHNRSTGSDLSNNHQHPPDRPPADSCAGVNVDQSLSIATHTNNTTDNVDSLPQDVPSLSPAIHTQPTSDRQRMMTMRAETEEEELEQSLSEMVLVTTNKSSSSVTADTLDSVDRMFMPPPQQSPAGSTTGGQASTGNGTVHSDPFARERQKRLLPSNTVSLGAGSFEGRSAVVGPQVSSSAATALNLPQQHQEEMCQTLIRDLNKYGVCVLDDFLGEERGQQVLSEVVTMYSAGKFKDGQLVQPTMASGSVSAVRDQKHIRGDKITWIGGREPGCSNIGHLINQVDGVITMANKMQNNGKLGDYQIRERTKAMVACYPGSGTHYVKHVDNPTRDGRCITAIYYLNPNWDAKTSGGLLRMFPESLPVVDIAPQFDRILFFWSDRRNPHEVQPAHRTRYAITLWYHDAVEREQALQRYQKENLRRQQEENGMSGGV